jgi:hypothetical protein
MGNEIVTTDSQAAMLEKVVVSGDLGALSPAERLQLYSQTCQSLGLNPLTRPFEYVRLNGKLTLYARRDATDQLRKIHRVSLEVVGRETISEVYVVTARATDRDGRADESTGAVAIKGLAGEALANAFMKAETKAKRRVTLSLVGLGWLDEGEVASIPTAQPVTVDVETGEIVEPTAQPAQQTVKAETVKTETTRAHWIDREDARKAWWAYTGNTLGLTNAEVHEALGVQHMNEYTGTMMEAKIAVNKWMGERAAAKPEPVAEPVAESALPF